MSTVEKACGVVSVEWTDDAEQLVLRIPRTLLEAHLADLVDSSGGPERAQLEELVMARVLNGARDLAADGRLSPRSRLRRVLAHMETHADQPLTPGDLARVGCMSVRALHAGFRDELGVPPMAHLRRIRLDRVHVELLQAAEPLRIGDVAVRWGFFHPSRFARQYQERFGELPSETARRGRA